MYDSFIFFAQEHEVESSQKRFPNAGITRKTQISYIIFKNGIKQVFVAFENKISLKVDFVSQENWYFGTLKETTTPYHNF